MILCISIDGRVVIDTLMTVDAELTDYGVKAEVTTEFAREGLWLKHRIFYNEKTRDKS